jgi:hypothetical protein
MRTAPPAAAKEKTLPSTPVLISPPNITTAKFKIRGDAPFVMNNFGQEAREMMAAKQRAGSTANKGRGNREAKDFDKCYRESMHVSHDNWHGIPASAFRAAMVSACRLVGFKMTLAKLSIFIVADGFDRVDDQGLIRITKGSPKRVDSYVRNETGVADIRPRAHFDPGWEAEVRIQYDADQFTLTDVTNLLLRVGKQVGVGAGRPDSTKSTGMGWGTFEIVNG